MEQCPVITESRQTLAGINVGKLYLIMSGQYSGLQAWIKKENNNADLIPCCWVLFTSENVFLCLAKLIYFFLSGSTYRWKELLEALGPKLKVVKALSETWWFARHKAVSALHGGYDSVFSDLQKLSEDDIVNHRASSYSIRFTQNIFKKLKTFFYL